MEEEKRLTVENWGCFLYPVVSFFPLLTSTTPIATMYNIKKYFLDSGRITHKAEWSYMMGDKCVPDIFWCSNCWLAITPFPFCLSPTTRKHDGRIPRFTDEIEPSLAQYHPHFPPSTLTKVRWHLLLLTTVSAEIEPHLHIPYHTDMSGLCKTLLQMDVRRTQISCLIVCKNQNYLYFTFFPLLSLSCLIYVMFLPSKLSN